MGRIDKLAERYQRFIALPWRKDLPGAQRILFLVYDKIDERRLRARKMRFELATRESDRHWTECDLTATFAKWMAGQEYKESYFASPEDLEIKLEDDFLNYVAQQMRERLAQADEETVVAVFGIASLFGLVRVSDIMSQVERDIKGRLAVFFPGEYEDNNYRLLDARDGWNYMAVPITVHEDHGEYDV
ncbi:MAG: DUF1788 domain-containing protein [Gammaproteobacteria bacterium]|nr:DUF1788 domain-containing protein [Gammaproteobacteria bacterium]MCY4339958.1 DUF1788 domain-containing protein [Gammaproteobacteria bacterium]